MNFIIREFYHSCLHVKFELFIYFRVYHSHNKITMTDLTKKDGSSSSASRAWKAYYSTDLHETPSRTLGDHAASVSRSNDKDSDLNYDKIYQHRGKDSNSYGKDSNPYEKDDGNPKKEDSFEKGDGNTNADWWQSSHRKDPASSSSEMHGKGKGPEYGENSPTSWHTRERPSWGGWGYLEICLSYQSFLLSFE